MDYGQLSEIAFILLIIVPIIASAAIGLDTHLRRGRHALALYLSYGIAACMLYAAAAGLLANWLIPPPYDPAFAGGRGLDLRGVGLIIGGWIGAAGALATTIISYLVYRLRNSKA